MSLRQTGETESRKKFIHPRLRLGGRPPGQPGTQLEFGRHARGEELVCRFLEDHADARRQLLRRPGERPGPFGSFPQGRLGEDLPGEFGQQARQGQGRGRFACPIRTDDSEGLTGAQAQVQSGRGGGGHARSSNAEPICAQQNLAEAARRPTDSCGPASARGGGVLRHPDAAADERFGQVRIGEDLLGRTLGDDPVTAQHDDTVDVLGPQLHPVFDDEHGRLCLGLHGEHGIADLGRRGGIDIGRRFVEDDDLRGHRMDPGQSQPLLLPTGQGSTRMLRGQIESHRVQGLGDLRLDGLGRESEVLHPERHIITDAGEDHLRIGILEDQPGAASARIRFLTADEEFTGGLTRFLGQDTGDGVEERRFARSGGAEQQHLLSGRDLQVERTDRRRVTVGVRP